VARGSSANSNSVDAIWDYGLGIGGPIVRDRIWFYEANRSWGTHTLVANNYFNASPVFYRYVPDLSRPALVDSWHKDIGARVTCQINPKNKLSTDIHYERLADIGLLLTYGIRNAPEATYDFRYGDGPNSKGPMPWTTSWTYTASSRLLFQAWFTYLREG